MIPVGGGGRWVRAGDGREEHLRVLPQDGELAAAGIPQPPLGREGELLGNLRTAPRLAQLLSKQRHNP